MKRSDLIRTSSAGVLGALGTVTVAPLGAGAVDVVTLRMAAPIYVGLAPLYLGVKKGFLAEQSLKIDVTPEQDTASTAAALISGALDVAFVSTTSLVRAISQGLKLRAIGPVEGVVDPKNPRPPAALMVTATSPIKSLRDLNGKTVAVPTLNSGLHLETMADVDRARGDSSTIKFTQIPFSGQIAALNAGRVDAATLAEPYISLAQKQGARSIGYPDSDIMGDSWVVAWCVAESYIDAHADVVKRFMKANATSELYAAKHLDEARAVIPDIIPTITAEQAKTLSLATRYVPTLDVRSVERYIDLLTKYGGLKNPPNARDVIYTG